MNTHNFTYIMILFILFSGCSEDDVEGCMDIEACNYNADAVVPDGSCTFEIDECGECGGDNSSCEGCGDSSACNYDSEVTVSNNALCEYAEDHFDCDENCLSQYLMNPWTIQVSVSVQPWNVPTLDPAYDNENYFGANSSADDDYDSQDIPEPPSGGCTNCLSAYFIHDEWDYPLGNNFTQDYKSTHDFCESKSWILTVDANCTGEGELEFDYINIPEGLVVEMVSGADTTTITDNQITGISLEANTPQHFIINVTW